MLSNLGKDLKRNKYVYLMLAPVVAFYLLFHYGPMYGIQVAFKDYSLSGGMWNSPWIGFKYFEQFFDSYYFGRIVRNTVLISLYELLFAFPASILLAIMLNEVRQPRFKRTVQSLTYMPHFISIVVVVGMMTDFLATDGLVNHLLTSLGLGEIPFLREPGWFRTLYIGSGIWQHIGWGSIVYLASIANIDPTLYEAAKVDGAGRFKQIVHITIPGMIPIIVILFILKVGSMMAVGDEKILLMYNSATYETADVIGTYVYRKGILETNMSYSAAVGLFNSLINFALLILANSFSKRVSENKLW
ncbi:sugar ABC transporter permease [Paenibacillus sp. MY03]|jgi:putative aldouronate transport system permease protein|uniref:ABC transporter permease n=1 Tax=Paenibacillus sp. MY03 TaxID=302980 RepID=UPI000B3CA5AB|nr:ABC transporter permease subunit [Paenibacillus sp. MY03]OUS69471.1 sugar ABC transporter permease [Paenibacillus sp. MY03]